MPNVQPLAGGDPQQVGSFEVTGRLGEGGQGIVYLGRGGTGANVAIKLLHAQLIEDEAARSRFVREVEVTKRVARFCTAQVLEAGMADTRPYIASEYVAGPSLHQQLREEGPRQGSALDRLAINTATALAAIHQAGVVHRDFKPGNVLMGPDGPVVIDFGIARALDASGSMTSAVSQVIGTPAFMAPEQLADGVIGPPTDMFAWAVTMAYAANGAPAFGHRSIPKVINRILNDEPDLGVLEGRLRDIVAACLTKDPSRRPTARALMDELMGQGPTSALSSSQESYASAPTRTGPSFGANHDGNTEVNPAATAGRPGDSATRTPGPYGTPEAGTMRMPAYGPGDRGLYGPSTHGAGDHGFGDHGGDPRGMPPAGPYGEPKKRSRAAWIIAGVAAGLVALMVGVAIASSGGDDGDKQAAAPPTEQPAKHPRPIRHKKPAPLPTSQRPTILANPHTPQGLCGAGFRVIDVHGLGGARVYLLYKTQTGSNCVVTMVPRSAGKVPMSTSLMVKGGGHQARSGNLQFYAGPVRLPAKGKCVMWGGAWKTARWMSGWSHCRR